ELPITGDEFKNALSLPEKYGFRVNFNILGFPEAIHPNSVKITAITEGQRKFEFIADSTGGGSFLLRKFNGWDVSLTGDAHDLLVEIEEGKSIYNDNHEFISSIQENSGRKLIHYKLKAPPQEGELRKYENAWYAKPVYLTVNRAPIFESAAEMAAYANEFSLCRKSIAEAAMDYESSLLGLPKAEICLEMEKRLQIMLDAVKLGLSEECPEMFLLAKSARNIYDAERNSKLPLGGVNTRAAIRAMAAMQVNSGQGVICAAPTGGSAGVIPGIVTTLIEDMKFSRLDVLNALWAAGVIGMIIATRATFAAEVAGCQVEIAAAGAMGAAAVVQCYSGDVVAACDAAAIALQNSMGLVCDLVQGIVEIPCHTRNASYASQAFICADLIAGGYYNPIGLDETIDAVFRVGKMLPAELRCTSTGGIATAPSALAIKKRK
ncbi:MAG: L-serine ammonia-lyase, iron-sulfur-dependent, subunit alpha, partial [Synergistaceae bacterium]|nr:L-serine ammonia-lyase, iron-sulfur-dependent, subunit alpha [Synergistaceae bacterium]